MKLRIRGGLQLCIRMINAGAENFKVHARNNIPAVYARELNCHLTAYLGTITPSTWILAKQVYDNPQRRRMLYESKLDKLLIYFMLYCSLYHVYSLFLSIHFRLKGKDVSISMCITVWVFCRCGRLNSCDFLRLLVHQCHSRLRLQNQEPLTRIEWSMRVTDLDRTLGHGFWC